MELSNSIILFYTTPYCRYWLGSPSFTSRIRAACSETWQRHVTDRIVA
jgi:hypothetical protein